MVQKYGNQFSDFFVLRQKLVITISFWGHHKSPLHTFRSDVPGGHCKFKVKTDSDKGPAATEVQLLGAAGNQFLGRKWPPWPAIPIGCCFRYQQMKQLAFYGGFKGFGKGKAIKLGATRTC